MNKKLLCTAVGGALALGAGAAQAYLSTSYQEALVPYVVKDANRTTVVTVIVDNSTPSTSTAEVMHLQYWTKSTTDANTASCKPSSVTVPVTQNDMVTFDTAGILGYPLFGDTTNPSPLGMSISYAGPQHGYLVVQGPYAYTDDSANLHLQEAYWLELDLANGGAHGDKALMSDSYPGGFAGAGNGYNSMLPSTSANYASAVNFFPASVAATAFTVTPLGSAMVTRENNQLVMQVFNANAVQGAYDRNENGVDGTVPQTVRCVGRLTPSQLMPGVVANAAWAAQGGFGYLANLGSNGSTSVSTVELYGVVYQVESSTAGGKFVDNATNISTYSD